MHADACRPQRCAQSIMTIVVAATVLAGGLLTACMSQPDGSSASDGKVLYDNSCAICHGTDLRGTGRGPSQLSIVYEPSHHSDESYRRAITQGVQPHHWNFGPMPPIPTLDSAQIDAIIAYVRTVQQREGFEPYPPTG